MTCGLSKHIKETETHWVGNDGSLYPINDYINHGYGGEFRGFKDLPKDNYPYTIKYTTEFYYLCCKLCKCDNKPNLTK
jgi:hypothetical protein